MILYFDRLGDVYMQMHFDVFHGLHDNVFQSLVMEKSGMSAFLRQSHRKPDQLVNTEEAWKARVPLVKRYSGGGTVSGAL